jgi:hypothetical protein
MPAFFVINSIVFRLSGVSSSHFRLVELAYALALFITFSLALRKLYGPTTALLASLIFLALPVNMFLLYISWTFLFSLGALISYGLWTRTPSKMLLFLTVVSTVVACLHHVSGFFVAPSVILANLLLRSSKKNSAAITGVLSASLLVGLVYLGQLLLLRHDMEMVTAKAMNESVLSLKYLLNFFGINAGKYARNVYELVTLPMIALGVWRLRKALLLKREPTPDNHLMISLLLFPVLFHVAFLSMVVSHLHFLTMAAPYLSLAASQIILDVRRKKIAGAGAILLILYLVVMSYHVQVKYDKMIWNEENQRGYALAQTLHEVTKPSDLIAGAPGFGYNFDALSPAFFFYLDRNYIGQIDTLKEFVNLRESEEPALFLFSTLEEEQPADSRLGEYLFRQYPYIVEPGRRDIIIFQLRSLQK